MSLVRILTLAVIKYNIFFSAEYIPGLFNALPDLLSRDYMSTNNPWKNCWTWRKNQHAYPANYCRYSKLGCYFDCFDWGSFSSKHKYLLQNRHICFILCIFKHHYVMCFRLYACIFCLLHHVQTCTNIKFLISCIMLNFLIKSALVWRNLTF